MRRYGIRDYRLPQNTLGAEINCVINMGVEFKPNMAIGEKNQFKLEFCNGRWKSSENYLRGYLERR